MRICLRYQRAARRRTAVDRATPRKMTRRDRMIHGVRSDRQESSNEFRRQESERERVTRHCVANQKQILANSRMKPTKAFSCRSNHACIRDRAAITKTRSRVFENNPAALVVLDAELFSFFKDTGASVPNSSRRVGISSSCPPRGSAPSAQHHPSVESAARFSSESVVRTSRLSLWSSVMLGQWCVGW